MTRMMLALAIGCATTALGQDSSSSETMKSLIKEMSGPSSADGGLDVSNLPFTADSVRQVVAHSHPRVIACYEEMLASREKAVEGLLMTHFTITPEGLVKGAKILKRGTTLHDAKLNDCVVAVLSTMVFPQPTDGKEHPVEFPFNLKAIH